MSTLDPSGRHYSSSMLAMWEFSLHQLADQDLPDSGR